MVFPVVFWVCLAVGFYCYAGYPLLLAAIAAMKRPDREPGDAGTAPTVTLLISALNEEDVIARKLENSLQLAVPGPFLQILVATDGSDDRTAAIVESFADRGIELSHHPERRGKMAAINRAMPQVRGEIVVFSDANNMFEPDALVELVKPFADATVGAATGSKRIIVGDGPLGESEGLYWRYEAAIMKNETRLGSCTAAIGEMLAVRRDLYEAPPDRIINDDFFMIMRMLRRGHRVVHVHSARSYERVSASAQAEIARRIRMAAGRYQALSLSPHLLSWKQPLIAWQVISHKFLRLFIPFAMLGALVSVAAAAVFPQVRGESPFWGLNPPWLWAFLILHLGFYGAALLGRVLPGKGKLGKLLYLPTFLVNSNTAILLGFFRFASGKQTVIWDRVERQAP